MGITVRCNKTGRNFDMGCSGFMRWRMKIAELYDKRWYDHYSKLMNAPFYESKEFYDEFDKETLRLLNEEYIDIKIVDFCLQSDCGGKINYGACKNILKAIGDYTDDRAYGYAAYADHDWEKLKAILLDCAETKSKMSWD